MLGEKPCVYYKEEGHWEKMPKPAKETREHMAIRGSNDFEGQTFR
jgi:hypothetical protein